MRLLLDTHTFLWFVVGDARTSTRARALIEDMANERHLSIATLWEIAIKVGLGKLSLSLPFEQFVSQHMENNSIQLLSITTSHLATLATLPLHHRDPFDRLLIAQAIVEQMPVVSTDQALDSYPVERLW